MEPRADTMHVTTVAECTLRFHGCARNLVRTSRAPSVRGRGKFSVFCGAWQPFADMFRVEGMQVKLQFSRFRFDLLRT